VADVTVVVPARNAAATIGATLDALGRQRVDHEVVVVDDASTDATAAIADRGGARVVRHDRQRGPAASRRSGVAAACAPLLAFTDADCVPADGWLAALAAALRTHDLARGPIGPPPGVPVGRFDRTLYADERSPWFQTANLAVTRELHDRVGGFAPFSAGTGPGLRPRVHDGHIGEDAVFAWRARRLGARIAFVPGAVVHHAVQPRTRRAFVAERRRLRFFPALVRELPELRDGLPLRTFLDARTARVDLALAGLVAALAARRPAPLLLAAPYARLLARERGGPRDRAAIVAGDLVGAAALAQGSFAARTPLL
jgi:glycosyltransferase involved in cell wall biosynthesis